MASSSSSSSSSAAAPHAFSAAVSPPSLVPIAFMDCVAAPPAPCAFAPWDREGMLFPLTAATERDRKEFLLKTCAEELAKKEAPKVYEAWFVSVSLDSGSSAGSILRKLLEHMVAHFSLLSLWHHLVTLLSAVDAPYLRYEFTNPAPHSNGESTTRQLVRDPGYTPCPIDRSTRDEIAARMEVAGIDPRAYCQLVSVCDSFDPADGYREIQNSELNDKDDKDDAGMDAEAVRSAFSEQSYSAANAYKTLAFLFCRICAPVRRTESGRTAVFRGTKKPPVYLCFRGRGFEMLYAHAWGAPGVRVEAGGSFSMKAPLAADRGPLWDRFGVQMIHQKIMWDPEQLACVNSFLKAEYEIYRPRKALLAHRLTNAIAYAAAQSHDHEKLRTHTFNVFGDVRCMSVVIVTLMVKKNIPQTRIVSAVQDLAERRKMASTCSAFLDNEANHVARWKAAKTPDEKRSCTDLIWETGGWFKMHPNGMTTLAFNRLVGALATLHYAKRPRGPSSTARSTALMRAGWQPGAPSVSDEAATATREVQLALAAGKHEELAQSQKRRAHVLAVRERKSNEQNRDPNNPNAAGKTATPPLPDAASTRKWKKSKTGAPSASKAAAPPSAVAAT